MVEAVVENLRGATLMQDGAYHCVRCVHSEINSTGETADKNSPQLPMDQAVTFGAQLDPLKRGIDFRYKRHPEARFPILVPLRRIKDSGDVSTQPSASEIVGRDVPTWNGPRCLSGYRRLRQRRIVGETRRSRNAAAEAGKAGRLLKPRVKLAVNELRSFVSS
jgi:hypothetical protein